MSNTLVPQIEMLSPEVVDMINRFRAEEGNRKVLQHKSFMTSIRKEIEALKNAGVEIDEQNILLISYTDSMNREKPCYKMSKSWILQMCNKESALVRFKTQQYIEALENRLKQQQISADQIKQMIDEAVKAATAPIMDRLEKLIATKEAPKSEQISFIKTPLRTPYTATKIGDQINRKPETINKVAANHGIITKTNNGWVLNKKYEEAGYGKTCNDGQWKGTFVRYSEKGAQEIIKIFKLKGRC